MAWSLLLVEMCQIPQKMCVLKHHIVFFHFSLRFPPVTDLNSEIFHGSFIFLLSGLITGALTKDQTHQNTTVCLHLERCAATIFVNV